MLRIRSAMPDDHAALVDVWLRSVRATHHFLAETDIASLLPIVRDQALAQLELWVLMNDEVGAIAGFLGMTPGKVEALFIAPEYHRRGGGRMLIDHARSLHGDELAVDVNEQNPDAVRFYEAVGFVTIGRSPLDDMGRPFPLVHMRLRSSSTGESN